MQTRVPGRDMLGKADKVAAALHDGGSGAPI